VVARLTYWFEFLVLGLTFVASLIGVSMVVLAAMGQGWGAPVPRRRFLPLLFALGLCFTGWLPGHWGMLALLCAIACIGVDQALSWVFIPLGFVRTTYYLAKLGGQVEPPRDLWLRPVLLAARALRNRPSPAATRFVTRRLAGYAELGPLGAAAAAILAEIRGDVAGAVGMLRGVSCVQEALLDRQVWPVLRDVMVNDVASGPTPQLSEPQPAPPAIVEASLAAQAALARRLPGRARAEDVAAAVGSLDALASSPSWQARLQMRAATLGVGETAVSARATLLNQLESDLAEATIEERWPSAWLGSVPAADAVRARVREQRLATVERLADELRRRARAQRDLSEPEEWQAWGEFARVSQELELDAAAPSDHQLHFRGVHRAIWDYGYRQAFVLGRRRLGGTVFLRQRRLAYAAEAADAYDVIEGNLRATRAVASPVVRAADAVWFCHPGLVKRWQHFNSAVLRFAQAAVALALFFGAAKVGPGVSIMAFALVLAARLSRSLRLPVMVEVLANEERIAIQTLTERYSFAASEVELLPSIGQLSRVRLARTPQRLPRTLWTVHASRSAAEQQRKDCAAHAQAPPSEPASG
jgi:hypothetical protein